MQKYTGFLGIVFQNLITYVTGFAKTVPNGTRIEIQIIA